MTLDYLATIYLDSSRQLFMKPTIICIAIKLLPAYFHIIFVKMVMPQDGKRQESLDNQKEI